MRPNSIVLLFLVLFTFNSASAFKIKFKKKKTYIESYIKFKKGCGALGDWENDQTAEFK